MTDTTRKQRVLAATVRRAAVPELTIGRYPVERRIAVGGMAEVFLARSDGPEGFRKPVVIKRMLPHLRDDSEYVEMFLDEARLVARFNHDHLLHAFELFRADDTYCLAMEYVEGRDLRTIIRQSESRGRHVGVSIAIYIIAAVARALQYAHSLSEDGKQLHVIHRDISPSNIMVTSEGGVKLIDFGVAKHRARQANTRTGIIKGKVPYMSPEQLRGKSLDHRSDLYSVGAVLYEALTRKRCVDSLPPGELADEIAKQNYEDPRKLRPDLPAGLALVISGLLAYDPEDRIQTAGEVATALDGAFSEADRPTPEVVAAYMNALFEGPRTGIAPVFATGAAPVSGELVDPAVTVDRETHRRAVDEVSKSYEMDELTAAAVSKTARADVTAPFPKPRSESGWSEFIDAMTTEEHFASSSEAATGDLPPISAEQPTSKKKGRRVALGAIIAVLVVGGAAALIAKPWTRRSSPPLKPAANHVKAKAAKAKVKSVPAGTVVPNIEEELEAVAAEAMEDQRKGRRHRRKRRAKAAAESATVGSLTVETEPSTVVYLRGRRLGRSPVRVDDLEPGQHLLTLRSTEHGFSKPWPVIIDPGETTKEVVTLGRGKLRLEVKPAGVLVFIGKNQVGQTPLEPLDLYEGVYTLRLENLALEDSHTFRVEIRRGEIARVAHVF